MRARLLVLVLSGILGAVLASCASTPCPAPVQPAEIVLGPPPVLDAGDGVCSMVPEAKACRNENFQSPELARWHSPRCDARDPACGPEVVRPIQRCSPGSAKRRQVPGRGLGSAGSEAIPGCRHDADCRFTPCSELCLPYQVSQPVCRSDFQALEVGPSTLPDPTWCGCVEGKCALFTD